MCPHIFEETCSFISDRRTPVRWDCSAKEIAQRSAWIFLALGPPFHHDKFSCELMQKRGMPAPSPRSILPWAPWVGSQLLPRNELMPHTIILVSLSHYHFYVNMFIIANTHEYVQTIIPINSWKSFSTQVYWWLFRMIFCPHIYTKFICTSAPTIFSIHPHAFTSTHTHALQ